MKQPRISLRNRPQMPRDAGFQLLAAGVHFVCACFNIIATAYHVLRAITPMEERHDAANTSSN